MNYARFHIHQPLKFGGLAVRRSLNSVLDLPQKFFIRNIKMEVNEDYNLGNATSNSRGALVVLEGLDRCGKTTQSSSLVKYLKECGLSAELWRFPDRSTSVGQMISSYLTNESQLDDHTIHLLFSANRWEKRMMMETKLKAGITLIVDRYSYSGVAFSSAKGLGIDWCKAPEVGLLAPDLVLYLDILPEKAAERGDYGSERYEKLDFQKKVARCYRDLFDVSWKIIDACQPVADIEKQVQEMVMECVIKCQNGVPLSPLWLRKANENAKLTEFQPEMLQLAPILNVDQTLMSYSETFGKEMTVKEGKAYMVDVVNVGRYDKRTVV